MTADIRTTTLETPGGRLLNSRLYAQTYV